MRLIDADALKAYYAWWECSDSQKEQKKILDTIVDLQPTVEVEDVQSRTTD